MAGCTTTILRCQGATLPAPFFLRPIDTTFPRACLGSFFWFLVFVRIFSSLSIYASVGILRCSLLLFAFSFNRR